MRRLALAAFVLMYLISCRLEMLPLSEFSSNPFTSKKTLSDVVNPDAIEFSAITDVHLGRRNSGISWFTDNYFDFLSTKSYPFLIQLGDFSDNGVIGIEELDFINKAKAASHASHFISVMGNHDRHNVSPLWNNDPEFQIAERYSYGKCLDGRDMLSIYKLDNSKRTIGSLQFQYLEETLKSDNSRYKIFIAHEIVASGGNFDMSLILFGLNVEDQLKLYKLMNKYKVGLILSGHHHIGNIEYHFDEKHGEFNLAAFHQRKTKPFEYESEGYFYDISLDTDSGKLTITPYLAETKEKKSPFTFNLIAND